MKYLKKVIFILMLIIIIILCVYFSFREQNKTNSVDYIKQEPNSEVISNNGQTNLEGIRGHEIDTNIGYIDYYTVCNCINNNLIESKIQFTPISIKKFETSKTEKFLAYGVTYNTDMNYVSEGYYGVYFDLNNYTYLVEKINTNNKNMSEISIRDLEKIEINEDNKLAYQELTKEYKYLQMFNNMKNLLILKPELLYEYLDEEYKKERFGNVEYFKQYVEKNRNHLINIEPKSYKENDDDTIIKIRDQYSNWYEFEVLGTMKYTVKLDNYIVMSEEDIEQYKKYDNDKKIKYNIQKWINMINSKDYEFAYNYLDETFKQQNYDTLDKFKNFMQSKYPDYYDNVSIKIKNEGSVYSSEVQLSVKDDEYADKYMTIIMKLKEGTDFVLSFDAQ